MSFFYCGIEMSEWLRREEGKGGRRRGISCQKVITTVVQYAPTPENELGNGEKGAAREMV
jgi:hypothetical protein